MDCACNSAACNHAHLWLDFCSVKDFCYGFAHPHCGEEYVAYLKESDSDFSNGLLTEARLNDREIEISKGLENGLQEVVGTGYGYDHVKQIWKTCSKRRMERRRGVDNTQRNLAG